MLRNTDSTPVNGVQAVEAGLRGLMHCLISNRRAVYSEGMLGRVAEACRYAIDTHLVESWESCQPAPAGSVSFICTLCKSIYLGTVCSVAFSGLQSQASLLSHELWRYSCRVNLLRCSPQSGVLCWYDWREAMLQAGSFTLTNAVPVHVLKAFTLCLVHQFTTANKELPARLVPCSYSLASQTYMQVLRCMDVQCLCTYSHCSASWYVCFCLLQLLGIVLKLPTTSNLTSLSCI